MISVTNAAHKRKILWDRQQGCCWICGGRLMATEDRGADSATLDHVIPRAAGGGGHIGNLRLAHRRCNEERGHKAAELIAPPHRPVSIKPSAGALLGAAIQRQREDRP